VNICFLAGAECNVKKKDIVKLLSQDGEIHFLLREHITDDEFRRHICLTDAEVVTIMKKEASKPLLLLRAE